MNLNLIKLDINIEHRVTQNAIIFMHAHFDRTRNSLRRGRSNHLIFVFIFLYSLNPLKTCKFSSQIKLLKNIFYLFIFP